MENDGVESNTLADATFHSEYGRPQDMGSGVDYLVCAGNKFGESAAGGS